MSTGRQEKQELWEQWELCAELELGVPKKSYTGRLVFVVIYQVMSLACRRDKPAGEKEHCSWKLALPGWSNS